MNTHTVDEDGNTITTGELPPQEPPASPARMQLPLHLAFDLQFESDDHGIIWTVSDPSRYIAVSRYGLKKTMHEFVDLFIEQMAVEQVYRRIQDQETA